MELVDRTDAQNPVLAHDVRVPIGFINGVLHHIDLTSGTSLVKISPQIAKARETRGLSSHIPLNQQNEFLKDWYIRNNVTMTSPIPGMITDIQVQKGQKITRGQELGKMEVMKMEIILRSPIEGEVGDISGRPGDIVGENARIFILQNWEGFDLENEDLLKVFLPWMESDLGRLPKEDLSPSLPESNTFFPQDLSCNVLPPSPPSVPPSQKAKFKGTRTGIHQNKRFLTTFFEELSFLSLFESLLLIKKYSMVREDYRKTSLKIETDKNQTTFSSQFKAQSVSGEHSHSRAEIETISNPFFQINFYLLMVLYGLVFVCERLKLRSQRKTFSLRLISFSKLRDGFADISGNQKHSYPKQNRVA